MTTDSTPVGWRTRTWRWTLRILRLAVVSYLAVLGFLYFAQSWLIFPGRLSQGRADAQVTVPAGAELVRLSTAGADEVVVLFGPALERLGKPVADAKARPTVIFFYGNGDCLANNVSLSEDFRRLGVNVAVAEYAGYGMSGGKPGEIACRETAEAAFDHVAARADVDPSRVFVAGWSIGSGVAIDLASRRNVAGILVFSAFTSLVDMARRTYPFIPVSWLLSHRFESETKLKAVTCPVFLAHGTSDRTIPFSMSERLAKSATGAVTLYPVNGADHDDLFTTGGAKLLEAVGVFLNEHGRSWNQQPEPEA